MSANNAINLSRFFLYFIPQDPDPRTRKTEKNTFQQPTIVITKAKNVRFIRNYSADGEVGGKMFLCLSTLKMTDYFFIILSF